MKPSLIALFVALALPLTFACGGSNAPTALDDAGIEDISEDEVLAASHFSDLSDDQKAQVRTAFQEAREALAAIRARLRAGEVDRVEAHRLARQVHEELIAELETILTDEQLARLRNHHRPDGGTPLTEDQLRQIHALRADLAAFAQSLREQVRAGELSAEEARARLREAVRRFNAAVCDVLIEGQRGRERFCAAAGG